MRTNLELSVREKVRDFVDSSLGDGSWVVGGETPGPGMEDVLINGGTGMEAVRVVVGLVGVVGVAVAVAGSAINRWSHSDVEAWLEEDHSLLLLRGEATSPSAETKHCSVWWCSNQPIYEVGKPCLSTLVNS